PSIAAEIVALRDTDLRGLRDDALDAHVSRVLALMARGAEMHFKLGCVNPFVVYDLVTTCQELLGWDEPQIMDLVAGLSNKSIEPAHRLSELARMAREQPAVRDLLEQMDAATADRLEQVAPEFAAAFQDYLKEYGTRALAFDLCEPT